MLIDVGAVEWDEEEHGPAPKIRVTVPTCVAWTCCGSNVGPNGGPATV